MARKHWVVYIEGETVRAVQTHTWARENAAIVLDPNARTIAIEKILVETLDYVKVERDEVVVCYKF